MKIRSKTLLFAPRLKLRLLFIIIGLAIICGTVTAEEVVDFENLVIDERVTNQYQEKGVYFLYGTRIIEPTEGTQSGSKALTTFIPGSEFDTGPLEITFTNGQSNVSMFVGLPESIGIGGLSAELRAYDINGDIVDQQTITLAGPGPTPITTEMSVSAPGNVIRKVALTYYWGARGYWEAIDNLTFSTASGADTIPPEVIIEFPADGDNLDSFSTNILSCPVSGYVNENIGLKRLSIQVQGSGGQERNNELVFWGQAPIFHFEDPIVHVFTGYNRITITAEDYAGNTGSITIVVHYNILAGDAELLIITPISLSEPFTWLKLWKDSTGIPCGIVSLELINTDPKFKAYWDLPEKVKAAISYAYEFHSTRYVMLVGDGDKFPMRYIKMGYQGHSWGVGWHVTDLYYADLYKSDNNHILDAWDTGNNHIYGEWGTTQISFQSFDQINEDNCDLRPDVAVGRVPASSLSEVTRYIVKVVNHESNSYPTWPRNVLLFNGVIDHMSDHEDLDWISENTFSGFNFQKYYRAFPFFPWSHLPYGIWMDQKSLIEQGYLNSYDEALAAVIAMRKQSWRDNLFNAFSQGVGIAACFDHGDYNHIGGILTEDDIPLLSNNRKLPIVFARACSTGKFNHLDDYYMDINGNNPPPNGWQDPRPEPMPIQPPAEDIESMAEALLVNSESGAAGFIGANKGTNAANRPIAKMFFESWDAGNHRLGDMWKYTLTRFANEILYGGGNNWLACSPYQSSHIHKYQLFGDPSLRVGGIDFAGGFSASAKTGKIKGGNLKIKVDRILKKLEKLLAKQVEPFPKLVYPSISDKKEVRISGQTQPKADLSLYEGLRCIGRTQADDRGNFHFKVSKLSAGLHRFILYSMMGCDRFLGSKTLNVEVHLTNPTVRNLKYPLISNLCDFVLSGETDFDNTWMELYEANQRIAFDHSRCGGKFILKPFKPLKPGKHIFTLFLRDAAGRVTAIKKQIKVFVRSR